MTSFVVKNNVESLVADNPLAQAAVTLNVTNGEGANFPSTFPFLITIWDESAHADPTDDSGMEIVKCTARTTDALTIVRAQEGTVDVAHSLGERVSMLITAGILNDATYGLATKLDGIEASADVTDAVNVASSIHGVSGKSTPVNADELGLIDSAAANVLKKLTWTNLKATLKTYFDTLYNDYTHPNHTGPVTSTGDGATTITDDAVTYAKIQDVTATDKILGRSTAGAGVVEEIACTAAGRAILDDADAAAQRTTLGAIADIVEDTTPQLGGTLDSNAHQISWSKGSDVASGTALTLGTDGNYFDITGTTTITSIATLGIGTVVVLHFDGALTLTHQAADLILPGGANITTAAGDEAMFVEYASGDWRCVSYTKADGTAVSGGGATLITKSIADIATDINGAATNNIPASYFKNVFDVADINAIIIHANIADDKAQQILSEITKTDRDLTSADNIYEFLDDWDDNKVCVARDGAGTVSTGFTNLFAQKNKFRPQWTQVSGTTTAAGGKMIINEIDEELKITSTFVTGTWEWMLSKANSGACTASITPLMYVDATHYYKHVQEPSSQSYDLYVNSGAGDSMIIESPYSVDANDHTIKITRDASGNFEQFFDGASKGTVTNTAVTTSSEFRFKGHCAGQNTQYSSLKVY